MTDDPVELDEHRGMAAQKATGLRRLRLNEQLAEQAAAQRRQEELERLLDAPTETWPEVAAKARYLIQLLADMPQAQEPRRKKLIAQTLHGLARLSDGAAARS